MVGRHLWAHSRTAGKATGRQALLLMALLPHPLSSRSVCTAMLRLLMITAVAEARMMTMRIVQCLMRAVTVGRVRVHV
jgi:hypothetical protein